MKKIVLIMGGILFFLSFVNAVSASEDVAYVVTNHYNIKAEFIEILDELDLTYEIIYPNEIGDYDLFEFRLLLLNDDFFSNWAEIPINDLPAMIVNGRNIDEWGWTKRVTTASQSIPIHVDLDNSHEITENFPENIQVYNDKDPNVYYLDKRDIYSGLHIIGMNTYDNEDAVIAFAEAGTVLTKQGMPDTHINANSVFFGITETEYWTEDTKQLFKNSLLWLAGGGDSFNLQIKEGQNLVSLPLISTIDVDELKNSNLEILSIKEYDGSGELVEATEMHNNLGYFIESTENLTLRVDGEEAEEEQSVELNEGLNLVGITSLDNMLLDLLPSEVIEISRRNDEGFYDIATYYEVGGWYNAFELEPGRGYWFKTNNEVTWEYFPV